MKSSESISVDNNTINRIVDLARSVFNQGCSSLIKKRDNHDSYYMRASDMAGG